MNNELYDLRERAVLERRKVAAVLARCDSAFGRRKINEALVAELGYQAACDLHEEVRKAAQVWNLCPPG